MSFLTVPQDNERQKRRHRGGEMQRGVGLTTGLGWSDSEDGRTFAPDPLIEHVGDEFDPSPQGLDGDVDS